MKIPFLLLPAIISFLYAVGFAYMGDLYFTLVSFFLAIIFTKIGDDIDKAMQKHDR